MSTLNKKVCKNLHFFPQLRHERVNTDFCPEKILRSLYSSKDTLIGPIIYRIFMLFYCETLQSRSGLFLPVANFSIIKFTLCGVIQANSHFVYSYYLKIVNPSSSCPVMKLSQIYFSKNYFFFVGIVEVHHNEMSVQ